MKKEKFYKLARPDGWDFYTGQTINYRENVGREVKCPNFDKDGDLCSSAFIHASREANQCFIGAKIPCSAYLVEGVPIIEQKDKCGFEKLYISKELKPEKLFIWNYSEAVNPIHPFKIIPPKKIMDEHILLTKKWDSVRHSDWDSVKDSIWYSVSNSIWYSVSNLVRDSVWDSISNSLWPSVWDSVKDSVKYPVSNSVKDLAWDSVWASVWAYFGSLFPLKRKQWKYTEKIKTKVYPFKPAADLWRMGLVPSYDGETWRLHGEGGNILWSEKNLLHYGKR